MVYLRKFLYIIFTIISTFTFMGLVSADSGPIINGENQVKVGSTINLTAQFNNGCLGRESMDKVCTEAIVDVTSDVQWTSNNDNINVNKNSITGIKEGTSIITATYTHFDGVKVSSNYEIKVIDDNTNNDNVTNNDNLMVLVVFSDKGQTDEVSNDTWTIDKNKTLKLETKLCDINTIDNNNNYDKSLCKDVDVFYSTSNDRMTIDKNGTLKTLKKGNSNIIIKSENKTINVKVKVGSSTSSIFKLPDTGEASSIIAVIISILLLTSATIFYILKINKLKVWE